MDEEFVPTEEEDDSLDDVFFPNVSTQSHLLFNSVFLVIRL